MQPAFTSHPSADFSAPIGVFDSGIGGLSVLRALRTQLPQENFVYFADSAYAPYGERGESFVLERSLTIAANLLQQHHIKALVVACNTATAAAVAHSGISRDTDTCSVTALDPTRWTLAVIAGLAVAVCVRVILGYTYASRVLAGGLSSWAWVFVWDTDAGGVLAGRAASGAFVFFWNAHTSCILAWGAAGRTATRWGLVVAFVACEFGVGQIATGNALCTPAAGHRARHGAATGKASGAGIADHAPQRAW